MIFTIAIPTYNNARTIHLAIESAINQKFEDKFEILVLNNNCTDNTSEVLVKYQNRINVIKNEVTVSMYENHNLCLKYSKGDYVVFCHSDDQLLPDALIKYYNILAKRNFPNRFVLWGRSMFRDFYPSWNNGGYLLNQIASGINSLNAFQGGGVTPSGTCYSRESLIEANGFVNITHKLAPSDFVTLWKLAINHFEFEMSDRIFFIRKYASTASGSDYNSKNIIESLKDSFTSLINELTTEQKETIFNHFQFSNFFNPTIFNILISMHLLNKNIIRKKTIKMLLHHPYAIRRSEIRKLLF